MFDDEFCESSFLVNKTKIVAVDGKYVFVEGIRKIVLLSDSEIRLKLDDKQTMILLGDNFEIKDIQPKTLQIMGNVQSICYEGKK